MVLNTSHLFLSSTRLHLWFIFYSFMLRIIQLNTWRSCYKAYIGLAKMKMNKL